jgi:RNA polymerase primary sigma factor
MSSTLDAPPRQADTKKINQLPVATRARIMPSSIPSPLTSIPLHNQMHPNRPGMTPYLALTANSNSVARKLKRGLPERRKRGTGLCPDIGKARLLTPEEEIALGRKIQRLNSMDSQREKLIVDLGKEPSDAAWASACGYGLSEEGVGQFSIDYRDCLEAKHVMVASNMRLVMAMAKKYRHVSVPYADLVQEGSLGLIRAAEKYDPARGFKFSTYASWWVQQAIFKAAAHHSRIIRLPVHVHNLLFSMRRANRELTSELGRAPTEGEVANYLQIPVARLKHYMQASRRTLSTETPSGFYGSGKRDSNSAFVLGDTLESRDALAPEDSAEMQLIRHKLAEVMNDLEEEERRVVSLRFGLEDGRFRSNSEIAEMTRCSQDWVRKKELSAMRKLRSPEHQEGLIHFFHSLDGLAKLASPTSGGGSKVGAQRA